MKQSAVYWLGLLSLPLVLSACDGNDSNNTTTPASHAVYEVSYLNTTLSQPISPLALVAHGEAYELFDDGERANEALERMAEGGDNSQIIEAARAHSATFDSVSTTGPLAPGSSANLRIRVPSNQDSWYLTSVGMLVNTNDAFAGSNRQRISGLGVGESLRLSTLTWDAGTEDNSEAAGSIPGPADSSPNKVGFDPARTDSIDRVRVHAGVISQDDGLSSSVLRVAHRFDAPSLNIRVTRVE